MTTSNFKRIWHDFLSLFFPQTCHACHGPLVSGEEMICTGCLADLPKTDFHRRSENEFHVKLFGRIPVRYVLAQFRFNKGGKVQKLSTTSNTKTNRPSAKC